MLVLTLIFCFRWLSDGGGTSVGGPMGGGGGGGGPVGAGRGDGRRKKQGPRKGGRNEQPNTANRRKTSFRIGMGKKGRAASLTARRGSLRKRDRTAEKEARAQAAEERRTINLPEGPVTVGELAELLDEKPVGIIKFLMTDLGVMASMTQQLDPATSAAVAEGFGKIVGGEDDEEDEDYEDNE